MARRRTRRPGRIESDDQVWTEVYGVVTVCYTGRARLYVDPREELCYRPEQADRVIPPWGCWVFVLKSVPVRDGPQPGCGYWAVPWSDNTVDGYDRNGRYSVSVTLPDGRGVRLWPYEYATLKDEAIEYGLVHGELEYHPLSGRHFFEDMPEVRDVIGALMLDGLSLHKAVYEVSLAGIEGADRLKLPAPGWFEALFEVPWA